MLTTSGAESKQEESDNLKSRPVRAGAAPRLQVQAIDEYDVLLQALR